MLFSKGLSEEQIRRTRSELRGRNVPYLSSTAVRRFLDEGRVPWLWICHMVGLGERRHRRTGHHQRPQEGVSERSASESSLHTLDGDEVHIQGHGPTRELLADNGKYAERDGHSANNSDEEAQKGAGKERTAKDSGNDSPKEALSEEC